MFERFTDRARKVVKLAQEQAKLIGHDHVGTEHILLGLIVEGEGMAAVVLRTLGITYEKATLLAYGASVHSPIASGLTPERYGNVAFTARAKLVFELSLREALKFGHNYIGTEHLLLGIIDQDGSTATKLLSDASVTSPEVRDAVLDCLADRPIKTKQSMILVSDETWRGSQKGTALNGLVNLVTPGKLVGMSVLPRQTEQDLKNPEFVELLVDDGKLGGQQIAILRVVIERPDGTQQDVRIFFDSSVD